MRSNIASAAGVEKRASPGSPPAPNDPQPHETEPRDPKPGIRAKRKYTVSEKVLAANRINIGKARAVGHDILYKRTPKRVNASRNALLKARRSPKYKPFVRHGLRAVDLRESAPQVGESPEDYDRHLEGVEGVLPADSRRERNGVRGLAQALWRRRRLFSSRVHRETLQFYLELEQATLHGLCPASVQNFSFVTSDVFLSGEGLEFQAIMERLDKRLVRVGEALLSEYATAVMSLQTLGRFPYRLEFLDQPPEVIGNGLVGPGRVKERMRKRPAEGGAEDLKPAELFDWKLHMAFRKSGLLAEWARLGYPLPDPRREEDFALHLRLIEAAFFGNQLEGFGLAKAENGNWKMESATGDGSPVSNFQFPVSTLDRRVAQCQVAYPELYQGLRNLAEATWQRLQVFSRQAEKEARELREKLEQAAAGRLQPERGLRERVQEQHEKWLDQLPGDPLDEALAFAFEQTLRQQRAEKQESEDGTGSLRVNQGQAPNPEPQTLDPADDAEKPYLLQVVESLLGALLCSQARWVFQEAGEHNNRVEEAFRALECAMNDAVPPLE